MTKLLAALLLVHTGVSVVAQNSAIDSLSSLVKHHLQPDTMRVNLLNKLTYEYQSTGSELDLATAQEALELARKLNYIAGEASAQNKVAYHYYQKADYSRAMQGYDSVQQLSARAKDTNAIAWALTGKGTVFHSQSNYPAAIQYYLQSVELFEKIGKTAEAASIMGNAGVLYKEMGNLDAALNYFQQGLKIHESTGNKNEIARFLNNIGIISIEQNKLSQAEKILTRCLSISDSVNDKHMMALALRNLAELKSLQGNYSQALTFGFRSLPLYRSLNEPEGIADDYFQLSNIYLKAGKADSALYYAKQSLSLAQTIGFKRNIQNTYEILAEAYAASHNFSKAYESERLSNLYKDSLTGEDKKDMIAGLQFQYELDKKQSQIELLKKDQQLKTQQTRQQRLRMYALIGGLVLLGLFAGVLVRSNRQKQRDNKLLNKQKEEIDAQAHRLQDTNEQLSRQTGTVIKQRDDLENTLRELKATQSQLIQREKMASLGELTAGIAHEIQNPLNFVNNFSEINKELLLEMKEEIDNGNMEEAKVIAGDVIDNEEKINHHGKRADSIVKGMLQHSRSSSSEKEPTDINALADEYLRLTYHGLRAKDKSFNANIETDCDESIGKINIIPQDIGRVLLNLYSNGFYSVSKKKKSLEAGGIPGAPEYQPTVSVSTKKVNDTIRITVMDNGEGIPEKVLAKVFQPFFTTKPTGQGTGLGLSLSYEVITREHGGTINVETKEGEFAKFVISLPLKT